MSQTEQVLEIQGSPAKLLGLLALGILMTGACALIVLGYIPVAAGSLRQFLAWVGLVFFALMTIIIVSRLRRVSDTVVTLSPEGIVDTRVAERVIPWAAIQNVGVWELQKQKVIVLKVPAEVEGSIQMTRMARFTRGPNKSLGADGLSITAAGLKISHDKLLEAVLAHVAAADAGHDPLTG
jgi:hypothetical protein